MKLATVKYFLITFLFSILIAFGQTPEQLVNMKNPPKKLVQDYAQIFDTSQLNDLENKLVAYNDSTSTQILVLTVKSLDGYPLETFANEIGQNWGVGTKDKDNGVVIVLSLQDRKITIRTGYGAQIYLPPSVNKSIIDNVIIPHFKEGDYVAGINNGIDTIFKAFAGKYKKDNVVTSYFKSINFAGFLNGIKNLVISFFMLIFDFIKILIFLLILKFINVIIKNNYEKNNKDNENNRKKKDKSNKNNRKKKYTSSYTIDSSSSSSSSDSFSSDDSSYSSSSSSDNDFDGFDGGSFGGGGASDSW